jgi:hypothetical protein
MPARILSIDPSGGSVAAVVTPISPIQRARMIQSPMVPYRVVRSNDVSLSSPPARAKGIERRQSGEHFVEKEQSRYYGFTENKQKDDREIKTAVQNAIAMLPASPANTLKDFLADVGAGVLTPAMAHPHETRIDTGRFWENRRVQNSLRRLLEALQERFDIYDAPEALGKKAFEAMIAQARCRGRFDVNKLDEATFSQALLDLGVWPAEMTTEDRTEAFLALAMPNAHAVTHVARCGEMLKEVNIRNFSDGLAKVPYNIPDFPVPTEYLRREYMFSKTTPLEIRRATTAEVCLMISKIFNEPKTGLDNVKDYFLCGLLSCEEIQASLDCLVPAALVDQAVMKIIRETAAWFRKDEWTALVETVRLNPELNSEVQASDRQRGQSTKESTNEPQSEPTHELSGHDDETPILLEATSASVEPPPSTVEARNHREDPVPVPVPVPTPIPMVASDGRSTGTFDEFIHSSRTVAPCAQTEPMPSRELLKEDPVIPILSPGLRHRHLVDWTTPQNRAFGDSSGSASSDRPNQGTGDEAAGTPQHSHSIAIEEPQETEASQNMGLSRGSLSGDDPVAWISLEMQNECHGPYLSRAFQRCCQIYQARAHQQRQREHD